MTPLCFLCSYSRLFGLKKHGRPRVRRAGSIRRKFDHFHLVSIPCTAALALGSGRRFFLPERFRRVQRRWENFSYTDILYHGNRQIERAMIANFCAFAQNYMENIDIICK